MKKFTVQTLYSGDAIDLTIYANKASDAKRHVQIFFRGCKVLKVNEVKEDKKEVQGFAA